MPGWPVSTGPRSRDGALRVLRRHTPTLLAFAAALVSVLALVPRPAPGSLNRTADYVIFAGSAGLRWDDINPTDTPNVWRLADDGSIGALSVRSARRTTCPGDGWVTLGAGEYARLVTTPATVSCPPLAVEIIRSDREANLPGFSDVVADNRELSWGTEPGSLAEAVRCTGAIGPAAALAASHPYGRVDRYAPALDAGAERLLAACSLSMVDLGTVDGTGSGRRAAARRADAALGLVLGARPERSVVVVAGLADTGAPSRLHVAVAQGPGFGGGWLNSPTTGRAGYLQLVDLAPTALAALDRPIPTDVFSGGPVTSTAERPRALAEAVGQLVDADREASVQREVGANFFAILTIVQLALFGAMVPLLRRARRPAGPSAPAPVPRILIRTVETLLVAAALAVPAALIADLVPWWRWDFPGLVFVAVHLAVLVSGTTLVMVGTSRRRPLAPLGGVAAVAASAVALDVLTGARLQLNGVAGYSAPAGGRYVGLGVVGLGVLVAGVLLAGGSLAQRVSRPWRPFVTALVGAVGVVVVGSPYLGADAIGAVALSAGVCVAAVMATGGWLTVGRLVWAIVAACAVTGGFALIDLTRVRAERSSVGRFVGYLDDGTAGSLATRIAEADVVQIASSPLTVLVLGAALFVFVVLLRHWGGLKRLYGLYPAVRAALVGIVVAGVLGGLVEGAGFNVLGAALATAVPLAALGAWRVLDHADDRTPIPAEPPSRGASGAVTAPQARPDAEAITPSTEAATSP